MLSRPLCLIFRELSKGRAHGKQIVASDEVWEIGEPSGIRRIRLIADMNDARRGTEAGFLVQKEREQKKLIDVAEPFAVSIVFRAELADNDRGV